MIYQFEITLLLIAIVLGVLGGFIDNAFGMGYGLLTPIFILLGFSPLIVVPTLLLSQMIAGFSGTIFHQSFKNVNFSAGWARKRTRAMDRYLLFTLTGVIGIVFAALFVVLLTEWFMLLYIGLMMLVVGIIVSFKIKFAGSWTKLYVISVIAGFNKAISGGGYGPLVTSGQIMSGSGVKSSVGVTQFSESTISAIGFLTYMALHDLPVMLLTIQLAIIMVISGAITAPFGALFVKRLDEDTARKIVGLAAITLGIITLIRITL